MSSQFFKHNLIFIYIIGLFLNIKIDSLINFSFNNQLVKYIINEILVIDFFIFIFAIFFIKEILLKLQLIYKKEIFKLLLYLIVIGAISIMLSLTYETEKQSNSIFVFFFYFNSIKIFFGFLIFIILVEKYRPEIDVKILILSLIIIVIGILINFYSNNHISRFYYPFTNVTLGYNLLGLIAGLIFFTLHNCYFESNKKHLLFYVTIAFLITFFTLSKTAILSLFITFVFYNLIFIKGKSRINLYLSLSIILLIIFFLDIIKYQFEQNSFSFLDFILHPTTWLVKYNSLFFRIEHVWLSNYDMDLTLLSFLFGEGIYSAKTHDSLYFAILSRFGFVGLYLFFTIIIKVYRLLEKNKHNVLSFILLFGLTSEMMLQSNIINPILLIFLYLNFQKKYNKKLI